MFRRNPMINGTGRWEHFWHVHWDLLMGSGPFVRLALGWASLLWALMLWSPGDVFVRPGFALLAGVFSETTVGWLFFAHFAGVMWRFADRVECRPCAMTVNVYGFVLWSGVTWSINASVGIAPSTSLDIVGCIGAVWSIVVNDVRWRSVTP
jgi:hypothetical protein